MPTAVITAFMSASPLAMKRANSSPLPQITPKPRWPMNSLNSLLSQTFFSEASSFTRTSFGRPLGAAMPRHAPVAQPDPVASLRVGTAGKRSARLASITASERTLPASISERASGSEHGTNSTPPATRSCRPGAAPCEGTHGTAAGSTFRSASMPASARCQMPPWPVPEALNLPGGAALIAAITSFMVLYDESARTWKPAGSRFISASGV